MIQFGQSLREAREAKGLSIADISAKTHMMSRQIEALEREDLSVFPAAVYGRGFVKLYCETVGLDAKTYIDEFMDIWNGNRQPTIHYREKPAESKSAERVEPEVKEETLSPYRHAEPIPKMNPAVESAPLATPEPQFDQPTPPQETAPSDEFRLESEGTVAIPEVTPIRRHAPSRYAAPTPIDEDEGGANPLKSSWIRPLILIIVVGIVLFLIARAFSVVYRLSMEVPEGEKVVETPAAPTTQPAPDSTPKAPEKPTSERKPIQVSPLYID